MMDNIKLTIELVPDNCWYTNLRSALPRKDWDMLRRETYALADYKCEICGGVGSKHPVECHEIWTYDEWKVIQTLEGLIALCPKCHEVKHIGLARVKGNEDRAKKHLKKINGWDEETAVKYINESFRTWYTRSVQVWVQDLSWLGHSGIILEES